MSVTIGDRTVGLSSTTLSGHRSAVACLPSAREACSTVAIGRYAQVPGGVLEGRLTQGG